MYIPTFEVGTSLIIVPGKSIQFGVLFMDSSQNVQNGVTYSFKATDASGSVVKDVHDHPAQDGTGVQAVTKIHK